MRIGKTLPYSAVFYYSLTVNVILRFDQTTNKSLLLMQDALGRVRSCDIVFLKKGTPNIVWSNCRQVLLFSIKNGRSCRIIMAKGNDYWFYHE